MKKRGLSSGVIPPKKKSGIVSVNGKMDMMAVQSLAKHITKHSDYNVLLLPKLGAEMPAELYTN